ncbi:hypothetical protein FQA39_LY17934 [Lamprigera yunnana]|nr:hypothetical protein FQA39_LY17934 [Lamprigera yunnana]
MANGGHTNLRLSGYLEKKSKLRLVSPWKRYWFVLEGRLLLYYRSKDEYDALSPCKGSINLCPPCNVKPAQSVIGVFQIECRANTVVLRAEDRSEQERWMQALLAANAQFTNAKRMSHFRYSLDDIPNEANKNSMPYRVMPSKKEFVERFQKIGAQTHRINLGSISMFSKRNQYRAGNDKSQSEEQISELIENDQYGVIREENFIETGMIVENEHYATKKSLLIENDEYCHLKSTADDVIVENVDYIKTGDDVSNKEIYSIENKEYIRLDEEEENITRHPNKQNVEHLYERISKDSNVMENSKPEYIEYDVIDKIKEFEELYEDPDSIKKIENVTRHKLQSEETSSQNSTTDEAQKKKCRFKMFRHFRKASKNECPNVKLKSRSGSFLRRVWKKKSTSLDSDVMYEAIDYDLVEKQIRQDQKDLQMLQELQDILQLRKNILQEKLNRTEQKSKSLPECVSDNSAENLVEKEEIEDRPDLPPRQSKNYKDVDSLSISLAIADPDTANKNDLKSIDEILKDLDKDRIHEDSQNKVKSLIEKFNDIQNENDGILRKKTKSNFICNYEDDGSSAGLIRLLDELSKVTSAPILTPGVTSSLVTPILTEEEWLRLTPIRRRRMSDPDYDVPRPHRSLQLHAKSKELENLIPATQFFGPILISENLRDTKIDSKHMDPDSLELQNSKFTEEKDCITSYCSHNYHKDKIIYAQPKCIIFNNCDNIVCDNKINEPIEDELTKEENYIDSLEPLAETSTAF